MPTQAAHLTGRSRRAGCNIARRGFTLLEILLVLVITGILVAAIAAAINIHMRVSEAGRSEVEQAQLARVLLRRIADDLRSAVPHVEPVPSEAGATAAEIAATAATASGGLGGAGGGASTGSGGSSSGGSSGGSSSGSSGGSGGAQTLQPLQKLSTLKPLSASSSSGGSSSSSSTGGATGGGTSTGGSSGGSSGTGSSGSSDSIDSEPTEDSATIKPPGIYGDQYTLSVDVSRGARPEVAVAGVATDAPGDVKTISYQLLPITGATVATGLSTSGLYRQSTDRAVTNFDAASGSGGTAAMQLLADEVAAIEYRYFDGTTWQTSWDSSGGTLPTAVEIILTFLITNKDITEPKQYRLTVAIPAAQAGASTGSTDTSEESSSSSSATGTTP